MDILDLEMTLESGLDIEVSFEIEVTSYINEPAVLNKAPEDCSPAYFDIEYRILPETISYYGDDGETIQAPDIEDEIIAALHDDIEQKIIND